MQKTALQAILEQLLASIEHALQSGYYLPAQILIYAGIDAAAWLSSDDKEEEVGKRFRSWVERWMLPAKPLPATAHDLYAARCAVLHTFTADSRMSKKGAARRIALAIGAETTQRLQAGLHSKSGSDVVAVHIDDLYEGFRLGFANCLESLQSDPAALALTVARMEKYPVFVEGDALKEFLK